MFAYSPPADSTDAGFAVVTDRFVALIGAEASLEIASELYTLLEDDATGIDDVLDVFASQQQVERLAIVEVIEAETRTFHVAVHGRVSIDMEGVSATRLSGPTSATWISSEARGVRALRLSLDVTKDGSPRLPIRRGVVMTTSIGVAEDAPLAPVLRAPAEPKLTTEPIRVPRPDEIEADRGARTQRVALPEQDARAASQPPVASPTPLAPDLDDTEIRPFNPLDDASASEPPQLEVDDRELEETGSREPEPGSRQAEEPGSRQARPPGVKSPWALHLPDGTELDLGTPVVIGRRPWKSAITETGSTVHVVAPSPNREISGAHVEFSVVEGVVQARDLDSTNGTVIQTDDRPPRLLHGGRSTTVVSGDILDLGEFFCVVVSARS